MLISEQSVEECELPVRQAGATKASSVLQKRGT